MSTYSDKEPKVSNINGNIIHVTVNNFIAPLNNVNNLIQPVTNNFIQETNVRPSSQQGKKPSETDLEKYRVPLNQNHTKKDSNIPDLLGTNDSFTKILNDPNIDKSILLFIFLIR